MSDKSVLFHVEQEFDIPCDHDLVAQKLADLLEHRGITAFEINYILCSEQDIIDINRQYLNHDYPTDIITFDNSESDSMLESDLFICPSVISQNAVQYEEDYQTEYLRVLIHGLLHLSGNNDKTESELREMRNAENYYLTKLFHVERTQ